MSKYLDLRIQEQARKKALREKALGQQQRGSDPTVRHKAKIVSSGSPNPKLANLATFKSPKVSLRIPQLQFPKLKLPSAKSKSGSKKPIWQRFIIVGLALPLMLVAGLIPDLLRPNSAQAAINLRGVNSANATGTSRTLGPNVSTKPGDIMIAILATSGSPGTVTVPSGWTAVGSACTGGSGDSTTTFRVWRREYVSTDTTWGWSWTTSQPYELSIATYQGVDRTNPIHAIPGTFCKTGTGTALSANTITTTVANTWVVGIWTAGNSNNGTTIDITPTSATERFANSGNYSYSCGLLCNNTAQYDYSASDSSQASATSNFSRSATTNISTDWVGTNFALNPAVDPSLAQAAYRWLANANSTTPGSALAANNTAITGVKVGDIVRLRMLVAVSTAELQVNLLQYKLQIATKGASCASSSFSDVDTASGGIRFADNATPADGAAISTTVNDPSDGGRTIVAQTYEEANNFNSELNTPSGQDAMWDFAITNNSAPSNTSYCFRMVQSDGTTLNSYTSYPELTSINISYNQSAYRWFNNADSTTPGSAMVAQDTQITQVKTNDNFRLRMLIRNDGTDAVPVAYENYKLQFATLSGTCAASTYADVATASGAIRYKDNATPADGGTAVSTASDPSDGGRTIVLHNYEEANNFSTRVSQPANQDGLWDFSLTNNSAAFGTVYCFRAVKADDTTFSTYTSYPQITILNPTFEQSAYRWFTNANSANAGAALVAQDTPKTNVVTGDKIRLRMLLHIAGDPIVSGTENFKLQYAVKVGANCDASTSPDETYGDVATASGDIRYSDNSTPADGAATSAITGDPTHSGHSNVPQTYEEANNFTTNASVAVGQDGLWDFSLTNFSAPLGTTYCFRAVRSSGSTINTYTSMPEFTSQNPTYNQSAFRWFSNTDSANAGAALVAQDTAVIDIAQGSKARLRMLIHLTNDSIGVGTENYKLQFATKSGTCDTAFSGETYSDLSGSSGAIQYFNNPTPADGATTSTITGDPTHGGDSNIYQTYEEANNFTSTTAVATGQDGLWDFSITNVSAAQGSAYCFRAVKSDGSLFATYTSIPELNTATTATNQSAYRWYSNSFSSDFLTITNNPTSGDDEINAQALDTAGGYIYQAGYEGATTDNRWRISKRSASEGSFIPAFGGSGCTSNIAGAVCSDPTTGDDRVTAIAIDVSGGYLYAAGYDSTSGNRWRVEKRSLADGSLATGTTSGGFSNGVLVEDVGVNSDQITAIALDTANGQMYLGGFDGLSGTNSEMRMEKRNLSDGTLVTAFDSDGIITEDLSTTKNDAMTAIVLDTANSVVYFGGYSGKPSGANSSLWRVEKRAFSNGALVSGFGNNDANCPDVGSAAGVYCVDVNGGNSDDRVTSLALDSTYIFITGNDTNNSGQWRVDRITLSNNTATASLVSENPTGGDDQINALYSDGTYLYLGGYDAGVSPATTREWRYEKRTVAGGLVTAFDGDGILPVDPTSGTDQINAISVDTGGGYIYAAGFDSTGSNQWRAEKRSTTDGTKAWLPSPFAAQDTRSIPTTAGNFRLRMLIHASGEVLGANGITLKLQAAQKVGTCDTGFVGETYSDIDATTTDIRYGDNSLATDASTAIALSTDPTHGGDTVVQQEYVELNNLTNPNALQIGQDGLWDFALTDFSAFGNYCFRIVKSDGSLLGTYSVIPEVVFCDRPKTDNLLRSGNFFCDDSRQKFYWSS